jgi:hypothetical protein
MNFKLVTTLVANIIKAVENSAIASVKTLTSTTFSSKVVNFPKSQAIKGTVTVANQKKVEKELQDIKKALDEVKKTLPQVKATEVDVKNFPKQEKIEFPKSFEVSNLKEQKDKISVVNLQEVWSRLETIDRSIRKIKLDPKIDVKAPEVNVPAPIVSVNPEIDLSSLEFPDNEELLSEDPKKYVPVRLTDGDKFYEALVELIGGAGGGGGGVKFPAFMKIRIEAEDVNNPGIYQEVQGQYNDNGHFELLTAGSGGSTPAETFNLVDTAGNNVTDTLGNTIIYTE